MRAWKWSGSAGLIGVVVLSAACVPPEPPPPPVAVTERVSLTSVEAEANAGSLFTPSATTSDDGRYVVFQTDATNLVAGDDNAQPDVFVRDRVAGTTVLVSEATGGGTGDGPSRGPSISGNGRYVAFDSGATDLIVGDTNGQYDVFVRDLQTGTTERVSLTSTGAQSTASVFGNWGTLISDDGRYVTMESYGALTPGDTNGQRDVYVRDRVAATTTRASEGAGGAQISGFSQSSVISGDGRWVAFETDTDGVVAADTNGQRDIYVKDLQTGAIELASVDSDEVSTNASMSWASISDDGRFVVFGGFDSNLVPGDTDVGYDVFVRDRTAGTTVMASLDANDVNTNGFAYTSGSSISDNGRQVAFYLYGGTETDGNGFDADVFVRDLVAGTTTRASIGPLGVEGNGASFSPSISGDGKVVSFWSDATNLVTGDTNGVRDVFVRVLGG